MKRWPGLKVGNLIEVEFLDHSYDSRGVRKDNALMQFKVWGKVKAVFKKHFILTHWEIQANEDKAMARVNNEECKILTSTLIKVRRIDN